MVTLVAQYLDVQLRYPIRQMASRSFIQDYCPAIEPAVDAVTAAVAPQYGSQRTVEFPLFSEGQDTTRSAYAVFLLNKVLDTLLMTGSLCLCFNSILWSYNVMIFYLSKYQQVSSSMSGVIKNGGL